MRTKSSFLFYLSFIIVLSFVYFWDVSSILPDRNLLIPAYGKLWLRFVGSSLGKMVLHSPGLQHTVNLLSRCLTPEGTCPTVRHLKLRENIGVMWRALWTSQSSHHVNSAPSFSESHGIWWHFSSASDPGSFSIPALQAPAQSCSFMTFRPGHCKYTSPEYILKKQRNFGELKIQSFFKGPTALHSIHSKVICWSYRVLMN